MFDVITNYDVILNFFQYLKHSSILIPQKMEKGIRQSNNGCNNYSPLAIYL